MQKIISYKFAEILRYENCEIRRFCHTLSQLTQFLRYKGHLLDFVLFLLALKIMFSNLGSTRNSRNFHFFSTPLWGKKSESKFCQHFYYLIFRKSQKNSKLYFYPFESHETFFFGTPGRSNYKAQTESIYLEEPKNRVPRKIFFKVGRFDILLRKCNALDDFSFDMIKTCQNFSSETFVPPIVCIKDQKALYKSRKKKDTFEKFLGSGYRIN